MSFTEYTQTEQMSAEQEAQYIHRYLPLVNKILRQMSYHASVVIDAYDLQQIALIGLLTALRRYGVPDDEFPGYAKYRIRGAILDELRQADWRPRSLRQKTHQLAQQIKQLTQQLGREPEFADMYHHLQIDQHTYHEYLQSEHLASVESLDAVMEGEASELGSQRDNPERFYAKQQQLAQAIGILDQREQLILTLYYHHEMNFKEIALVLDVSEARVCQLNKRLNDKLVAHIKQSESVC
ncbi:FliA/WhiG family RNA polymerase sigma factor [Rosenbergiella australiborealis]|uniref:FliA/WhiG family RNA polymerase sigma factor n=2 Tax=Rosenbergiella TaxID=1356488 RepID=A0ABS5T5E1_9GAMM|nr:FliA/WhiG family RNA polymerase sigma factor [Rosenbergiella australiborealis]MBT0727583.1 FliA/WhiG family RNA polymerase sigma factor [Rosenbergiella australiborealis]